MGKAPPGPTGREHSDTEHKQLPLRNAGGECEPEQASPGCSEETPRLQGLNASSDMNLNVVLRLTQIQGLCLNKMSLASSQVREGEGGRSCGDSDS